MFDPQLIAARWSLNELPGEEIPPIACHALELGYDGKSLRQLAGLNSPTRRDIEEIVDGALRELGAVPIAKRDAARWMAKRVAGEITEGLIEPYQGACRIWLSYSDHEPELSYWSELATDYEVAAEAGKLEAAKQQIVQAARDLRNDTDFRAAMVRFQKLLEETGYSQNIIWLQPEDVLVSGKRFAYVRLPVAASDFQKAYETYKEGLACGRGLLVSTICETDHATTCVIWYPKNDNEVPQGIWPRDGSVKLSAQTGESRIRGRVVRNPLVWAFLKVLNRRKQDLKHFPLEGAAGSA